MVICAAEYASGVGVEEYVYDLRVVSATDIVVPSSVASMAYAYGSSSDIT